MEAPWAKIEQCVRGHVFCAEAAPDTGDSCSARIRASVRNGSSTTAKCPLCRVELASSEANAIRGLSAEQSIAALPWVCRHCKLPNPSTHEISCVKAPIKCVGSDCGCKWEGTKDELAAHEGACVWGEAWLSYIVTPCILLARRFLLSTPTNHTQLTHESAHIFLLWLARTKASQKKIRAPPETCPLERGAHGGVTLRTDYLTAYHASSRIY